MDEELIKMRDLFKESADIIDELLSLQIREANGEDVKKEMESVSERFMFKMVELSSFSR